MKTRIFVAQLVIAHNAATGERKPVIVVEVSGRPQLRTNQLTVCCRGCRETVAKIVYRPDRPMGGARVWIELEHEALDFEEETA